MMDPMTGQNRGYAFLSFLSNESAIKCVQMYDKYEIRNKDCYIMTHHRRYFYYPDYNDDINKIPTRYNQKRESYSPTLFDGFYFKWLINNVIEMGKAV